MKSKLIVSALALMTSAVLVTAQDASTNPPPPAPAAPAAPTTSDSSRRDRRRSPEEMQQWMNGRIKDALKTTDEEWTVLLPLIEKVQNKQREALAGQFGGWRRGGSGGSAESQALTAALESESTTPDDLKAKLTALREQRKKAAGELAQAREDLSKVLTQRQEARLVSMGLLE